MLKQFLNDILLSILQRIPYVQKLKTERDKAIAEKEDLAYYLSQLVVK